jgi:hypothetical protein
VSQSETVLSEPLTEGLWLLDDPLLLARYREGLDALGVHAPERSQLHVDAAGYSPELADALGDPFYLGGGPLEARGLWLGPAQLGARLVHPGLGFAAEALRGLAERAAREIAALTLREPLLLEVTPDGNRIARTHDLANARGFVLELRTPSGVFDARRRLEAMKGEFLASDRLWLDDEFLAEMIAVAERVRGLPSLPEGFEHARHRLGPVFFTPAFEGAYSIAEPGGLSKAAQRCVLAAEAAGVANERTSGSERLEVLPLTPESALQVLLRHRIARVDPADWDADAPALERLRHMLALDVILAREPASPPPRIGPREVTALLRGEGDLPAEHRELEEVVRCLRADRGRIDPGSLLPRTRLRLAAPTTTRPEVRALVRHLQAFLDPVDLAAGWCHAPDVFFARWPALPAARRAAFTVWLAEHGAALARRSDSEA